MTSLFVFLVLSVIVTAISWRTLFNTRSHGFYRFISWECIALLFAFNYRYWFDAPFTPAHLISWILLFVCAYVVIAGYLELKKGGKASTTREEDHLYTFEKTTELVDTGIYSYIRHPLYASLIYLTWGIYFKNASFFLFLVAAVSTVFLYITSRYDEKECTRYFGEQYSEYMKRSKMFVPFVF
ncbi:MAG: isoprenylcysteine carboxylmethyltransferase family protein [Bacteroidales bacterium]|nr:isoprenylcysteine carboxylmethyltransferase family protein [Bacteroidales bacterium]